MMLKFILSHDSPNELFCLVLSQYEKKKCFCSYLNLLSGNGLVNAAKFKSQMLLGFFFALFSYVAISFKEYCIIKAPALHLKNDIQVNAT